MAGKGDKRRPGRDISESEWDRIFERLEENRKQKQDRENAKENK